MKKYPVGIQDFAELREGGFHYIDKTKSMYELIKTGKHFFLSRPRRFGKSLLMSTLKYFFQGRKELFEGLWVEQETDYNWEPHPVVHFSFSSIGYKDIGLEAALLREVNRSAKDLGLELVETGLSARFKELIRNGARDSKLALLIDEYDKPLIDYIDDQETAETNRATLKNFFSVLKDSGAYLRFFLITGVSKFSKVSVFSDLNHLLDITLVERFATMTGITQAELDANFEPEIHAIARKFDTSFEEMRERIKAWYNGYSFLGPEKVYNPFSLLSFFSTQRFANFWWESGTPYFLMKLLRKDNQYDLRNMRAGSATFESYTLDNLDWLPLLFQTGYLTILDYQDRYRLYTLGYPNLEVKEAFLQHLLAVYRETGPSQSYALFIQLKETIDAGDIPGLVKVVNTLFSTVPYQLFESRKESFFHAILHLSFSGMGLVTQSEVSTSQGRVDTVVHTDDRIYIIEFKLDSTASAALNQIREKRYGSPYLDQGKEVIALGISFSSETKTVAEWQEVSYTELLTSG